MVFKALVGAFAIVRETVEGAVRVGKSVFYLGADMSPLLVGIGYVVGPQHRGAGLPRRSDSLVRGDADLHGAASGRGRRQPGRRHQRRSGAARSGYMGIGAMVVGGLASIVKMRGAIRQEPAAPSRAQAGPGRRRRAPEDRRGHEPEVRSRS